MSVLTPVIDHIDTSLKRIFLKLGVVEYHPVTDIYTEVRNLRRLSESLRKYPVMVTAEGNKPKGGGKYTARYAVFNNGYRVVPQDATHALYISGEQITDDGQSGPACIDTSPLSAGTNVTIHYEPPASELVRADAELAIITRAAYQGTVAVDVVHGVPGTAPGVGTDATPSNNIQDAMVIAANMGIEALEIHGTMTLTTGDNVSGMVIRGENAITTLLTIEPGANVTNCQFQDLILVNSVLDGYSYLKHCSVHVASGLEGYVELCMISGELSLSGTQNTYFVDCKSGCVGLGSVDLPVLNMAGSARHVAFRNFSGPIKITNSADPTNTICFDVVSGATVTLDSTCTAGTVSVRGIANIVNNSGMTINKTAQLDQISISQAVLSAAQTAPIQADIRKVNNLPVDGAGTELDPWGPV